MPPVDWWRATTPEAGTPTRPLMRSIATPIWAASSSSRCLAFPSGQGFSTAPARRWVTPKAIMRFLGVGLVPHFLERPLAATQPNRGRTARAAVDPTPSSDELGVGIEPGQHPAVDLVAGVGLYGRML